LNIGSTGVGSRRLAQRTDARHDFDRTVQLTIRRVISQDQRIFHKISGSFTRSANVSQDQPVVQKIDFFAAAPALDGLVIPEHPLTALVTRGI